MSVSMTPVCPAFATAESRTFFTVAADAFFARERIVRASETPFPRIRSTTRRAFLGETRMNRAVAVASIAFALLPRCYFFTLALRSPEWPWNVRVGENSPSLCPTMFSVTKTGMNFRPLWTAKVYPTISGVMVDRRDQVLMTFLSPVSTAFLTFRASPSSTYGPFLTDRPTSFAPLPLFPAPLDDVAVRRGVLPRLVPLGGLAPRRARVTAAGGPPLAPAQRVVDGVHRHAPDGRTDPLPAAAAGLPQGDLLVFEVPHLSHGRHAVHEHEPDLPGGQPHVGVLPLLREDLHDRAGGAGELAALPDLELDVVDQRAHRDVPDREGVPGLDVRPGAGHDRVPHREPHGAQDVPLLAVRVVEQRDPCGPVRVVLDGGDPGRYVHLVPPEIDDAVLALVPAPAVPDGDLPEIVPPPAPLQALGERPLGLLGGQVLRGEDRHPAAARGGRLVLSDSHGSLSFAGAPLRRPRRTRSCRLPS